MIHELMPWRQLTRTGVPALKVCRRPLAVGEVTVAVGETLNPELFPLRIRAERLRQFYESRRLEPVDPPPGTRQFYRERQAQATVGAPEVQPTLVAPIVPVASHVVADVPLIDVPTVEEGVPRPKGRRWHRPVPRSS